MLGLIRQFLSTRAAKVFFVLLIIPFLSWGVADVVRNSGSSTALATVGDRTIEPQEFQEAFRQQVNQVSRALGGRVQPTPAMLRGIAGQTLERLIVQAAIAGEVERLGLVVPDDKLREAVFAMPAFRGRTGAFDRAQFEAVLRQNNLTEGRFLELMRADIAQRQLIDTIQAGVSPPKTLLDQVYAFQRETRIADLVELPFAAAPEPPEPTDEQLKRAYEDDPQRYATPATRRIQAVILSPDTIARDVEVPEADIAAYYEQHKSDYGAPERRSVEAVVAQDETKAQALAEAWRAGADWDAMQKQAAQAGASAAAIEETGKDGLPGTLADAAFAAAPGTVTGPVKSDFGWQVFRVTQVTPGTEQTLAEARDAVRDRLARERAVDLVYGRANTLEDQLAAGTKLDDLPGDLGLAAITGTLDAKGLTPEGEPAPIPGSPELRQAIVTAAFAAGKDDPPRMTEGPGQTYFALRVEEEKPATVKPFAEVEAQVRDNFLHDARRRAQEVAAAKLVAAVQSGTSLDDAATVAGVRMEQTPPMARNTPTEGVPAELTPAVFALQPNEATMIETSTGFIVAGLAKAEVPEADAATLAQMRAGLDTALGQDIEMTFAAALRDRAKPTVNQTMLDTLTQ